MQAFTGNFPIIGIGASAGGLKALEEFFSKVPDSPNMAFVVVVHLTPEQPSLLSELLQKKTSLKITFAKDGEFVEINHVYIMPPKFEIKLYHRKIQLLESINKSLSLPIDSFFHSLAKDIQKQAVGIVLSGTGTDGTKGITEIKASDGLVLVQSEETAEFKGMPGSAIQAGVADMILPPEEMPQIIAQYLKSSTHLIKKETQEQEKKAWLDKVLNILRNQTSYDFSPYKSNTIQRRINRRMALNQINSYKDYINYMRKESNEIDALFNELLIGVTSFFRDKESFDTLKTKGFPSAFEYVPENSSFRVWVPACSTGEEVYSLAITIKEYLEITSRQVNLQLFGTDINKHAITKAREGTFPANIAADVGKKRLEKYFIKEGNYFRINDEIRNLVVFSVQNVLKDPPFSRLNMISCRNLLIYLNPETQKKLIPLFHYILKPSGLLMLGSSETTGEFSYLFESLDQKWKIFRRKEVPDTVRDKVNFPSESTFHEQKEQQVSESSRHNKENFAHITKEAILKQFAPKGILVDAEGNILHIEGRLGKFLEQPNGPPTNNILDQAKEGLYIELAAALRKAKNNDELVSRQNIHIKNNNETLVINLYVSPQMKHDDQQKCYLIVFEEIDEPEINTRDKSATFDSSKMEELERELQINRENHKITVEELKSANEELQSSNEELQSTNEELESSKEELQSFNEELQTVNAELQSKVEELSTSRDDMYNLLNSREIATIFVDNNILIRRFTDEATKIINLINSDLDRPLEHILTNLTYKNLKEDILDVLIKLVPKEREVQTKDGQWYSMRIMPYRTTDNRIEGAVLTFVSINEQKETQKKLEELVDEKEKILELAKKVFDMNNKALVVLDNNSTIVLANKAFSNLTGLKQNEINGKNILDFMPNFISGIDLKTHLKNSLEQSENFTTDAFEIEKTNGKEKYRVCGQIIQKNKSTPYKILLSFNPDV